MSWRDRRAKQPESGAEISGPSDLRDALALYRAGQLRPFKLYKRLTGPRQAWWEYCEGTARGTVDQLGDEDLGQVFGVIDRAEPPQSPGAVTDAARAAYAVSRALAAGESGNIAQQDLLNEAAGRWRNGPAAPTPEAGPPFSADAAVAQVSLRFQDQIRSVLGLLGNTHHDRGEAMAAICALMLAGAAPEARRAVQVRVVLAVRQQGRIDGVTGRLEVQVLPGGPPGLYPDPRALVVQPTDAAFDRALRLAWQFAGGDSQRSCVLWRVTPDADVPGYGIDGSSLGAAFAISLQQLLQRRPASRMLSIAALRGFLTRLRPSCVITGELSDQRPAAGSARQTWRRGPWLAGVGQMEAKLKTVGAQHLRLVAPAANRPASRLEVPSDVHVYWAGTLRQANRYARRIRPVRSMATGLALIAVLGGSVGPALAVHYNDAARQQREAVISANLTSAANGLRGTDPALAAQLDAAAYQAAPNAVGYTALLNDEETPLETVIRAQASALAFSADGNTLAIVPPTGPVTLWDTADPARATASLSGSGMRSGASSAPIAFSSDGRLVAAPVPGGGIALWNVTNPVRPARLSFGFGSLITSVAFSSNGNVIATGTQEGTVQLWSFANPAHPIPLDRPKSASGSFGQAVTALLFPPGGEVLFSGTLTGAIDTWFAAASGKLSPADQPVSGARGQQDQVSLNPYGKAVVTDASGDTFLYNLGDAGALQPVSGGPAVISPNGLTIATRDTSGNITLLNTTQPLNYPLGAQLPIKTPTAEGAQSPGPMIFNANGTLLAAGDNGTGVALWHLPAGYQADPDLPQAPLFEPDSIDGQSAAIAQVGGVFVQELNGNRSIPYQLLGNPSAVAAVPALGDNGHLLAFAEKGGSVGLWSLRSGGKAVEVGKPFATSTTSLSLSANGKLLVVGSGNGGVSLWNLADPGHPAPFALNFGSGELVSISPDGRTLATVKAGHVQLWDLGDPSHPTAIGTRFPLGSGSSGVTAVALSVGGGMLAVATTAGTVSLWNLDSAPTAYGEPLTSNFDSDYNYLPTQDANGYLPAQVNSVGVNALAFSTDGKTLTSINADSTIRIWDLQPATVISNICSETAQTLTAALWNQYAPGDPYEPPCRDDVTATGQRAGVAAPAASGASAGQASLCTSAELTFSSYAGTSYPLTRTSTEILVLTSKSRNYCSLTGVPSVSLNGPPDPPLGGIYYVASNALPDRKAVILAPGGQAHVNLTYYPALPANTSPGGSNPMWFPKTVTMTLPGTDGTLTTLWAPRVAVLRQDGAAIKGTISGPFLAGSGLPADLSSYALSVRLSCAIAISYASGSIIKGSSLRLKAVTA